MPRPARWNLGDQRVNLQDGLQCFVWGEFNMFLCRTFFRWPARLIYARSGDTESHFPNSLISYSPFPANPGLSSMEGHSGGELKARKVAVTTERPIAHFWRQFRALDLRLVDFEGAKLADAGFGAMSRQEGGRRARFGRGLAGVVADRRFSMPQESPCNLWRLRRCRRSVRLRVRFRRAGSRSVGVRSGLFCMPL